MVEGKDPSFRSFPENTFQSPFLQELSCKNASLPLSLLPCASGEWAGGLLLNAWGNWREDVLP